MKAFDPQAWSQLQKELKASYPHMEKGEAYEKMNKEFLEFFTFWVDAAEKLLEEIEMGWGDDHVEVAQCVRASLSIAEQTFGPVNINIIGAMLACMKIHWYWRDQLSQGLTIIENRLAWQSLDNKVMSLIQQAAQPVE